jgi:hypothetical protein
VEIKCERGMSCGAITAGGKGERGMLGKSFFFSQNHLNDQPCIWGNYNVAS